MKRCHLSGVKHSFRSLGSSDCRPSLISIMATPSLNFLAENYPPGPSMTGGYESRYFRRINGHPPFAYAEPASAELCALSREAYALNFWAKSGTRSLSVSERFA